MLTRRERLLNSLADETTRLSEGTVWAALYNAAQYPHAWTLHDPDENMGVQPSSVKSVDRALADEGISSWWDSPMDRSNQRAVEWIGTYPEPLATGSPVDALQRWTLAESTEPTSRWWTVPLAPSVLITTRGTSFVPAIQLVGTEDDLGRSHALVHSASEIPASARVYEVSNAQDWRALVEFAPLDVTASRREVWGWREPTSRWVIPDWATVSAQYDAVHLTVNAFLDLSGIPIDTAIGRTMIAGWGADETVWLTEPPLHWDGIYEVSRDAIDTEVPWTVIGVR